MHILLIEDDDRVAAALRPALHRHGMTTTRLDHGRGGFVTTGFDTEKQCHVTEPGWWADQICRLLR